MEVCAIVGFLFLVMGGFTKIFPPREINTSMGYRTRMSKSSQGAWDKAQKYSANGMIIDGAFLVLINLILKAVNLAIFKYEIVILIGSVILFYIVIENMLAKEFKVISK